MGVGGCIEIIDENSAILNFCSESSFFFNTLNTLVLVGCSSYPHQDRPVVEELSRSHGVGPQTRTQCGTYFGASEEVRVSMTEWA